MADKNIRFVDVVAFSMIPLAVASPWLVGGYIALHFIWKFW
jgi:hypothetical protein